MTKGRLAYALLLLLSLALVAVGVIRQVEARTADPTPQPAAVSAPAVLAPAPSTVTLSRLGSARTVPLGGTVFLSVDAAAARISAVRVYDGASLIGVRTFEPPARGRVGIQVEWPALRSGTHVLHAEAVGEEASLVGRSAPVRLQVVPGVVDAPTVPLPGNGRTPREIARASGLDLTDLTFTDADGRTTSPSPDRPLAADVVGSAPMSAVAAGSPPPEPAAGRALPVATLEGCRASVGAPEGVEDATVYEMTGGGVGFVRRGPAPYLSPDLTPGPHVFVVGAGDGPADSVPVSLEVPADCLDAAWEGDAALLDGVLTLPRPAARVWVYLGVDGGAFQRYPARGTVSGAFGTADLAGLLPSLRGRTLRMEVWSAGESPSARATRLARATLRVADPGDLGDLLGEVPGVMLSGPDGADALDLEPTDTALALDWSTASSEATGVIWQVLGRPLPSTDRATAPPVLLATGYSPDGDGGGVVLSGRAGRFTIPARLLLGGRPPVEDGGLSLAAVPTPTVRELLEPGSSFGTTPVTAPITGSLATLPAGLVPVPIGDVYVRVLPVSGATVVGDASNTVAVTLPPLSDAVAAFTSTSIEFDPGHAANPGLATCVRVTGSPTVPSSASIYQKGDGTYCPADFERQGGGCRGWCRIAQDVGSLVDVVAQVWDYIAQAYNTVVETIVAAIARFNPFCLTASVTAAVADSAYADAAADGCEAVATVIASVAVTVVLSSFGLPARLPESSELIAVAGGDLTAVAVAYLEQLGVPCSSMRVDAATVAAVGAGGVEVPAQATGSDGGLDLCAAMIGQAVESIRGQVKQAVDAETAATSGLPVPPAPQQFEPEPRGRYAGATIRIAAEPIDPATPRTARCAISALGDLRGWDVGGLEGTKVRRIGPGAGRVTFNPFSSLGFGPPWGATIRLAPIDVLYDTDEIGVTLTSSCFASGTLPRIPRTPLEPPLGRWSPGEAD